MKLRNFVIFNINNIRSGDSSRPCKFYIHCYFNSLKSISPFFYKTNFSTTVEEKKKNKNPLTNSRHQHEREREKESCRLRRPRKFLSTAGLNDLLNALSPWLLQIKSSLSRLDSKQEGQFYPTCRLYYYHLSHPLTQLFLHTLLLNPIFCLFFLFNR